jgi:hypothetical protein
VQMLVNKHKLLRTKMKHGMQIGKTKNPWQHNDVYR